LAGAVVGGGAGDGIYYVPVEPGIDVLQPFRRLPKRFIDFPSVAQGKTLQFDTKLPGSDKTWLAVARPLNLGGGKGGPLFFGALVGTKPKDQLAPRGVPLLDRLALAPPGGLV